jgi:hypothetical protein
MSRQGFVRTSPFVGEDTRTHVFSRPHGWPSSCSVGGMASPRNDRPSSRYEVFIGRSLAMCVHPFAAWRSTVRSVRALILAGYFAAGYLAVPLHSRPRLEQHPRPLFPQWCDS